MEAALQLGGAAIGIGLQILILAALLRSGIKRFWVPFAYTLANFLTTVVEIRLTLGIQNHDRDARYWYEWFYWRDEALLHVLILAVVINLIYYSIGSARSRRALLLILISGTVIFGGVSFLIHYHTAPKRWITLWMTPWMRDLYLLSTIMDLALWALLIAAKKKNYQLLMLSGGLGIQFTGEAIGESLRTLATRSRSHPVALAGNLVIMLANLTAMYIWWRAFRTPAAVDAKEPPPSGRLLK